LIIKILGLDPDPDPDWIRIRIHQKLDPDPDSNNPDPQLWIRIYGSVTLVLFHVIFQMSGIVAKTRESLTPWRAWLLNGVAISSAATEGGTD